jgi:hypothetical protein
VSKNNVVHKVKLPESILPEAMPPVLTILEAHNKMVGPLVTALIQPIVDLGGQPNDVMMLLESVIVGTLGAMTRPDGDEKVVAMLGQRVLMRLKQARIAAHARIEEANARAAKS